MYQFLDALHGPLKIASRTPRDGHKVKNPWKQRFDLERVPIGIRFLKDHRIMLECKLAPSTCVAPLYLFWDSPMSEFLTVLTDEPCLKLLYFDNKTLKGLN